MGSSYTRTTSDKKGLAEGGMETLLPQNNCEQAMFVFPYCAMAF